MPIICTWVCLQNASIFAILQRSNCGFSTTICEIVAPRLALFKAVSTAQIRFHFRLQSARFYFCFVKFRKQPHLAAHSKNFSEYRYLPHSAVFNANLTAKPTATKVLFATPLSQKFCRKTADHKRQFFPSRHITFRKNKV